jgi:hypothetical protein
MAKLKVEVNAEVPVISEKRKSVLIEVEKAE